MYGNRHYQVERIALDKYKLMPLDFSKIVYPLHNEKRKFIQTKKNPFKTMSDEDWIDYITSKEPHFTSEPYYELIPWSKLSTIETDAAAAGWTLILRTTNNTAYYHGSVDYDWYQNTNWIFGFPGLQFLLHLSYTEYIWSLIENDETKKMVNYFSLEAIGTFRKKTKKYEYDFDDFDDYCYDYDGNLNYDKQYGCDTEYYELFKPPNGWDMNGGMMDGDGTKNYKFMYVGNAKYSSWLGCYVSNKESEKEKEKEKNEEKDQNAENKNQEEKETDHELLETRIHPSFWRDWIENNKEEILPGKFKEVQISHWDDSYSLPGGSYIYDDIFKWECSFHYIKKFMKSSISNWIEHVYGYDCGSEIGGKFWEPKLYYHNDPNLLKKRCVSETKITMLNETEEWVPFNQFNNKMTLFSQDEIR